MRIWLGLAVTLLLTWPLVGGAVSRQGASDDYVCSHGRAGDSETTSACARLRYTGNDDAEEPTPSPAAPAATESTPSADNGDFTRGQSDRVRYETWFHSLSGDFLAGATFWEANRSVPRHAGCSGVDSPSTGDEWTRVCLAAQQQLSSPDRLRLNSPDYRRGWNHPPAGTDLSQPALNPEAPAPASETTTPATSDASSIAPPTAPEPEQRNGGGAPGLVALGVVVIALIAVTSMAVYFVPTLIAFGRKKRNTAAIFALNFFLGWTLLGWVLALVWSLSLDPPLPPARIS